MREVARWADIPVINMQCDIDHPTQTIADLMTLREHRGEDLRGLQGRGLVGVRAVLRAAAVGPAGAGTLLPRFGIDVDAGAPAGLGADARDDGEGARRRAEEGGGSLSLHELDGGRVRGTPTSCTRSPGGGSTTFSDEAAAAATEYIEWICDATKMDLTKPDSLYMHCLPADRGKEVTDEVIDGPHSVVLRRGREPDAHGEGADGADAWAATPSSRWRGAIGR